MDDNDYDDEDRETTPVADPDTGRVRLMRKRCATCIFRPGNQMHLAPGRVKGMVEDCVADQAHVVCHDTLGHEDLPGAVCRGWEQHPRSSASLAVRYIRGTGMVTLVDPDSGELEDADYHSLPPYTEDDMDGLGSDPMDNDIARDLLNELAARPAPADRRRLLLERLRLLCAVDPGQEAVRREPPLLPFRVGLAACALVADKVAGRHGYTRTGDVALERLPEPDAELLSAACAAVFTAQAMVTRCVLPAWRDAETGREYRALLDALQEELEQAAEHAGRAPADAHTE